MTPTFRTSYDLGTSSKTHNGLPMIEMVDLHTSCASASSYTLTREERAQVLEENKRRNTLHLIHERNRKGAFAPRTKRTHGQL